MENTMKQIILTGDRPTGRLHVGHYVGSLKGACPSAKFRQVRRDLYYDRGRTGPDR